MFQVGLMAAFLLMSNPMYAENVENSKDANMRRLVQLTDPSGEGVRLLKKLFMDITRVDRSEWDRLLEEIDFEVVVALNLSVYDKYFTQEEIKSLIEFYSSAAGEKLARTRTDSYSKQVFTQDEMDEIENFKETNIGKKYTKFLNKISQEHTVLARKYIDSLR